MWRKWSVFQRPGSASFTFPVSSAIAPENSGSAVPAGWLKETLSGRNLRLAEWTNREREEISGVTAEFQRNLKEIQSVEIECLNPSAPGALLAVTGTPADEP